jgi:hypothetical protein
MSRRPDRRRSRDDRLKRNIAARRYRQVVSGADGYFRWQRLLARRYFGEEQAGRPVLLFASDEELGELGGAAALAEAVAAKLSLTNDNRPFWPVETEVSRWRRGGRADPPPCLPLLAVTVLAATRMHRDELAAPHAYYIRLAEALLPAAGPEELEELRGRLSRGFDAVVGMWRLLDSWLEAAAGRRGISTIRTGGRLSRIGYPLSQALIRIEDRYRLTEFFAAMGIGRAGAPSEESLLHHLRVWASRPRGLSPRLLAALEDGADDTLLAAILSSLAAHWDGIVRERAGLRRAPLRACAEIDSWTMWWELERVPGIDEDVLRLPGGGEMKVTAHSDLALYELSGDLPELGATLRHGLHAPGGRLAVYVPASDLVAMRKDPTVGAWVAQPCMVPFEDHVLLVAVTAEAGVRHALVQAAAPGWKAARASLLPGWTTFLNVRITNPSALEGMIRGRRDSVALAMRPDAGALPVLLHGLPVATRLGRHHYLAGGEPDMLLPAGDAPRMVRAVLDGAEQTFRAAGFPVPLRILGPLPPGRHELVADGADLSFTVVETLGTAAVPVDPAGEIIQGAWVGAADAGGEPVLVRRGLLEAYAVLQDGSVEQVTEPAPPLWLHEHLGAGASYRFEYLPPPGTAWIAERSRRGWFVRPVCAVPPAMRLLSPPARQVWRKLLAPGMRVARSEDRWRLYARAAGELLGC